MKRYTFKGIIDGETTVTAKDEATARTRAMVKRWEGTNTPGVPTIGPGLGLTLISVEDVKGKARVVRT